jgi:hypothetical protein
MKLLIALCLVTLAMAHGYEEDLRLEEIAYQAAEFRAS